MTLTPVNADVVRLRNHRYHNSTIARSANYSSARSLGGTLGGTPQPLRLQDRFERLRDLEEELPREETESRKRSNHNTRKVGPYKKQLLTHNPHSCWPCCWTCKRKGDDYMLPSKCSRLWHKNRLSDIVSKHKTLHVGAKATIIFSPQRPWGPLISTPQPYRVNKRKITRTLELEQMPRQAKGGGMLNHVHWEDVKGLTEVSAFDPLMENHAEVSVFNHLHSLDFLSP